jgi:dolichyl-phosphate-mannose-protein mannosyltransferase
MPLLKEEVAADETRPAPALSDLETAISQKYPRLEWLIPLLFCAIMLAQVILSGRQLSQAADEATHLYAGYRYLKCSDLTVSPEHPPLAKVVAAVPLLLMNVSVDCKPFKGDALQQAMASVTWFYGQNWPAVLNHARAAVSIFAVGLCLLVWIGARRMFGLPTAMVASVLLLFEPNILAYGALIMTDVPVTCLMVLAVLAFYGWVKHRTLPFLLLTAMATGLALLTKHSGVVVIPILGALAIADAFSHSEIGVAKSKLAARNLIGVALISVLAAGVVWLGYGLRFAVYPGAPETVPAPATSSLLGQGLFEFEKYHLLPQAYLRGFAAAVTLADQTSVAFVAGKIYLHAPWFSTPFNFAIRSTAAMLALMLAGTFGMAMSFQHRRRERLFVLIPAVVFLAVCIHASINVSMRYLLPLIPFLLIAVADGCVEMAKRSRWISCALVGLVVLHAGSSLHAYPNYLSYASDLWGGPSKAYKYLPWVDIGQAYPEARAYLDRHPTSSCWLVAGWQWDPALYDLPCQTSGLYSSHEIPAHVHGVAIVSSTLFSSVGSGEQQLVAAFRNAQPKDRIAGSALLVYEGDFNTSLNAATAERNLAALAFTAGQYSLALQHSERELELAPDSAAAHGDHCIFLVRSDPTRALKECETTRELLLRDPLRDETRRKEYFESLELALAALKEKYGRTYGREPSLVQSEDASSK